MSSFKLPLTNVYAKGDYTVSLKLGSKKTPVNLLVDTGSSTLVINPKNYQPEQDADLRATPFVQEVKYGIGGWAGALAHSSVSFAHDGYEKDNKKDNASDIAIAIVEDDPTNMFAQADGILGLAYHHLNKSYDLSEFYSNKHISPALSYPWPFTIENDKSKTNLTPPQFADIDSFQSFLWQHPEQDVTPFFTQLVNQHKVANKFAFYLQRSSVNVSELGDNIANKPSQAMLDDPLNQGWLVLGGGEEALKGLYQGEFKEVAVQHDVYYNVTLNSIQVGDTKSQVTNSQPITTPPLEEKHVKNYFTNAIIDTGASLTVLTHDVFQQLIQQLEAINPKFKSLLEPFTSIEQQYKGIDAALINLEEWPDIHFNFIGANKDKVTLTCSPDNYWQLNTPEKGKACFKLLSQLPQWPNQTLIGLPLISNYVTVFDRSEHKFGVVKFAKRV